MDSFCPKLIMFQLEKFIVIMCHDTEDDAKFKGKLTCGLKNNIKNVVNFHASSQKSENLHMDVLLLSKVYYVLAKNVQKIYVS